ncbi:YgaP family membrane protein [Maritimibacter dapengensis]|uniref:DUF2892 domain-containing protein n=1 Tax=Maritimibacter dapengensis TaxID=2836868 RepID=A0ABS6T3G3_9RHOB|nr:DUF2892 domain-containing protein [Maritimibacter dapengensis]MBV7379248.1 DUF2892 domain-containing protein [Maritimibacter dapengensis]
MFKTNEGNVDRAIRGLIGIAGIVLFFMYQGTALGWIALVVGVVMLFTAVTGWCALYTLFGVNTCKMKS